jgi:hypothetical protein
VSSRGLWRFRVRITSSLVKTVKKNDSSQNTIDTDWQILGELELPAGIESGPAIRSWLVESLAPLDLHVEFIHKVLNSAWEAATRAMQVEQVTGLGHIHLFVFAPKRPGSQVQTWGFFRIEKVELAPDSESPRCHSMEFYLYPEG